VAQLQFLNGSRDSETQDLPEEAGLTLGAQDGSYILVKDQAVEPKHATVYSVKGQFYVRPESTNAKCFVNFRPLPAEGSAISDKDIVMFGRTLAKFWRTAAPSGGGGAAIGGGADPRVAKERDELKVQVQSLQLQIKQATAGASEAAQAQVDAVKREKDELARKLEQSTAQSRRDVDAAKQEGDRKAQDAEKARDAEKKAKEALDGQLADAKKRADGAEAELGKLKPEVEKKEKEAAALRKSLEAFQTTEARAKRDRLSALRAGSDVAQAVAALALPDALRDRLVAALRDEVDREVLSRAEGPVVPLRGLRCPGCDADLENELGSLKRRRQKTDALKALGVSGLSAEDAKALVSKARARS
jgi:predicted  nucleic acid-binding Zn-ribbon protein